MGSRDRIQPEPGQLPTFMVKQSSLKSLIEQVLMDVPARPEDMDLREQIIRALRSYPQQ